MSERIKIGAKEKVWDSALGTSVAATIVSITSHHVVLRRPDGKLWCMTKNDFESLRARAKES